MAMFDDMIYVSVETLPILAVGAPPEWITARRMSTYVSNLRKVQDSALDRVIEVLYGANDTL
jgi:hypothetical protein